MSTEDHDNDEAPSLMKPSAMKGRGIALPGLGGALPPGGFKPPLAGLKSSPLGGGVPAGLAEALAKRRQQKSKSEGEENNNNNNNNNNSSDNNNGEGEGKELKNGLRKTNEGANNPETKTENDAKPMPPPKLNFTPPSKLSRPELNSSSSPSPSSSSSPSSAEKNKLALRRSEENDLSPDTSPVEKRSSTSTAKGKRISSIQAGLNFNPLMLRPPSAGNSPSVKSGPSTPATPATPFSPPPVDLNAPPPLQHARSLLTNDAIKSRPKMSAQRKPQTRRARKANSTREDQSEATAIAKQVAEKTKSSPLPNGIDALAKNSDSTSSIEEEKSQTARKKSVDKLSEVKDGKASNSSQSGEMKNEEKCAAVVDAEEDVVDVEEVFVEDAIDSVDKNDQRKEETEEGDLSSDSDEKLGHSSGKEEAITTEVTVSDTDKDAITNNDTSKPEDINNVVIDEVRVVGETAKAAEMANDSPSSASSSASSPPSSPLPPPLPTSSPPPLD